MYHIFIKYYDRGDKMAIWNNTYVHGILDVDDGYYIRPYHYSVAAYSEDKSAIILGDSRINTIIHGPLNITNDENEYITTITENGDISAHCVIAELNSNGFKIDEYNVASIPPRGTQQMQIADENLNTVISGNNISLANDTTINGRLTSYGLTLRNNSNDNYINYGTDDPPINAIEGQIYFKIVS